MFWFSACYRRRNVWFALLVLCAGQRRNPQGRPWVEKSHCNRMRACKLCLLLSIKIFNVPSHHCPLQCVLAPSAGRSHRRQSARFMWSFGAWRNCLLRQALDDRQAGAGGACHTSYAKRILWVPSLRPYLSFFACGCRTEHFSARSVLPLRVPSLRPYPPLYACDCRTEHFSTR